MNPAPAPARDQSVAEAKASLREFAARGDQDAIKPFARHLAFAGAGLAVASVVLGRTKSVGKLLSTGLRVLPLVLRFL